MQQVFKWERDLLRTFGQLLHSLAPEDQFAIRFDDIQIAA
jgi:hypothetical protein